MTTPTRSLLAVAAAAATFVPAAAAAAAPPVIKSVSPMQAKVGEQLVVKGSSFRAGANQNTVVFMSDRGPTVFVKSPNASTSSMVVPLPKKLEEGMPRASDGGLRPNRFRLRVIAQEQGQSFTGKEQSPVISPRSFAPPPPPPPPDTDKDGIPDSSDPDNDNDFLNDSVEKDVRTDPLNRDSDGDRREDGWEHHSARDLNNSAVPYPAKRPYPNALDPADGNVDFDGDFLRSSEEHALWVYAKRRFNNSDAWTSQGNSPLWYSDGTQTSTPGQQGKPPAFQRDDYPGLYDDQWAEPTYPGFNSLDGDDTWSDDERDADSDGLNNLVEDHFMTQRTWDGNLARCKEPAVEPWVKSDGAYYGAFTVRPFAEPSMMDPDADNDGLLDAEDDQDNDDVPNYSELNLRCDEDPYTVDDDNDPATPEVQNPNFQPNVHPYNPCAPHGGKWVPYPGVPMSRSCPRTKPLGE